MSHPKWYRRAWLFIYRQRRDELIKAIAHFPYSDKLNHREEELAGIKVKIAELEAEED